MIWPHNKKFAFTIIDETDFAFTGKIRPIYDLLYQLNMRTTKTVWVLKSEDESWGQSLENDSYKQLILDLHSKGFEIALHNISNDAAETKRVTEGLEIFKSVFGSYPAIQTNHSNNNNIYWGHKRFEFPIRQIYKIGARRTFNGDMPASPFFWGNDVKAKIKYVRNLSFNTCNILTADPRMPYIHYAKKNYSNYWFSTTFVKSVDEFTRLMNEENINQLEQQGGLCLISTCMGANKFVKEDASVDHRVTSILTNLSERQGYFVPASKILDYLLQHNKQPQPGYAYHLGLNVKWLLHQFNKL